MGAWFCRLWGGICAFMRWLKQRFGIGRTAPVRYHRPLRPVSSKAASGHGRRKPDWVRLAVLALACELPRAGYRTLAYCFNLRQASQLDSHGQAVSVSKSFVSALLRAQRYASAQASQRACTVKREPIQTTWGMDLTGLPTMDGSSVAVFGVIDHGSRAILSLSPVVKRSSLVLLGKLLIAMGSYGLPRTVRADNEAVFKSWVFKGALKLLGVRQQFTELASPWQNGRIERFWRTLKFELQTKAVRSMHHGQAIQTRMKFASVAAMGCLLEAFKDGYIRDRPHQSLKGATPASVWNGQVKKAREKLVGARPAATRLQKQPRAPPAPKR
jgi:transposase InsO family protein